MVGCLVLGGKTGLWSSPFAMTLTLKIMKLAKFFADRESRL